MQVSKLGFSHDAFVTLWTIAQIIAVWPSRQQTIVERMWTIPSINKRRLINLQSVIIEIRKSSHTARKRVHESPNLPTSFHVILERTESTNAWPYACWHVLLTEESCTATPWKETGCSGSRLQPVFIVRFWISPRKSWWWLSGTIIPLDTHCKIRGSYSQVRNNPATDSSVQGMLTFARYPVPVPQSFTRESFVTQATLSYKTSVTKFQVFSRVCTQARATNQGCEVWGAEARCVWIRGWKLIQELPKLRTRDICD